MFFFLIMPRPPSSTLFPYTTLFRSHFYLRSSDEFISVYATWMPFWASSLPTAARAKPAWKPAPPHANADRRFPMKRSEEHTSELQSRENLVCRLLLEKKKKKNKRIS